MAITAYLMVDIEVTDAEGYEEYKKLSPPAVAAYGGNFIAAAAGQKFSKAIDHRSGW